MSAYGYWHFNWETPEIYEHMGVDRFRRCMPAYGNKWKWKQDPSKSENEPYNRIQMLGRIWRASVNAEKWHTFGAAALVADEAAISALTDNILVTGIVINSLQVVLNVYPIMVQRYNRARIARIAEGISAPSLSEAQDTSRLMVIAEENHGHVIMDTDDGADA